jgi:hypothetical protein
MIASPKKSPLDAERLKKLLDRWTMGGQHTRPFDKLPGDLRSRIADAAGLVPEEQPLAACYFGEGAWTLLTTQRIIWQQAERQSSLAWEELVDVRLLQRPARPRTTQHPSAICAMEVVTRDGHAYGLELEDGPPFFGIWTTVKLIINAHRRTGDL